jgi:AcrR family transcriptional regulator
MTQPSDIPSKSPKPDGRVARGEITRARVLDAAERCFAATGFDAVSIRQIAAESGVTLGVVGFHGGSKEELFRTVLARRTETLNRLRRESLAQLRANESVTLEDLIDAYITPYLDIASRGDPQWRAYAQLIARLVSDDRYYPEMKDRYDPVALEYLAAIAELYPEADPQLMATALVLTVASMISIVASNLRIDGLSGKPAPRTPLGYRKVLVDFCAGGFRRAIE